MVTLRPADLIRRITGTAWFQALASGPLRTLAQFSAHLELQRQRRLFREYEERSARLAARISPQRQVLAGPFAGLRYPSFSAFGSSLPPKLIGSYEAELHPVIQQLRQQYDLIVDLGCAEGYYAIGLALLYPDTPVHAYDINAEARAFAAQMAHLNHVDDRLQFHALASQQSLDCCRGRAGLVIVDCEGCERLLFSHQNIDSLALSDLIIELHPCEYADVNDYLLSLFSGSHHCQLIAAISDADKPVSAAPLAALSAEDKRFCVCEFRGAPQHWLICRSKACGPASHDPGTDPGGAVDAAATAAEFTAGGDAM